MRVDELLSLIDTVKDKALLGEKKVKNYNCRLYADALECETREIITRLSQVSAGRSIP
jgi:hypothetical protein